jgi:hypothetical protein
VEGLTPVSPSTTLGTTAHRNKEQNMSDNKVFVLRVDEQILGAFAEEVLAKIALADFVLADEGDFETAEIRSFEIQDGKPSTNPLDYPDVVQAIKEHKKTLAIKCYRQHTNLGLRESKEAVEAVEDLVEKNPIEPVDPVVQQWGPHSVIDGEGDRWVRGEDDLYRIAPSDAIGRSLDEIDDLYGGYSVDQF